MTAPRKVTLAELPTLAGSRLGTSALHQISQDRIQMFADATDDRQWIHLDPLRAITGPFGSTIAHGYLTLSMGTALLSEVLDVTDSVQVINYGLDKVRFPAPLPSGASVEMVVDLDAVENFGGGVALHMAWTFQVPGTAKPVCVARAIFRYYRDPDADRRRSVPAARLKAART